MLIYIVIAIIFFSIGKFYTKDSGEGVLLGVVATVAFYIGVFGLTMTSINGHNYLEYKWSIEPSMGTDIFFGAIVPLICLTGFCYLAFKMFKKYRK